MQRTGLPEALVADGSLGIWDVGSDTWMAFIVFVLCGWFENEAGVHTPGVLQKSAELIEGKGVDGKTSRKSGSKEARKQEARRGLFAAFASSLRSVGQAG